MFSSCVRAIREVAFVFIYLCFSPFSVVLAADELIAVEIAPSSLEAHTDAEKQHLTIPSVIYQNSDGGVSCISLQLEYSVSENEQVDFRIIAHGDAKLGHGQSAIYHQQSGRLEVPVLRIDQGDCEAISYEVVLQSEDGYLDNFQLTDLLVHRPQFRRWVPDRYHATIKGDQFDVVTLTRTLDFI